MDTNKLFSFQRIAMVMKRDFFENWKNYLHNFIGLYAGFTIVMVGNMWGNSTPPGSDYYTYEAYLATTIGAFVFIYGLLSCVLGAMIMDPMKTKEGRIAFLMLPATMVEKFLARFLTMTVGVLIATLIAFVLADLTHLLVWYVFSFPEMFGRMVSLDVFPSLLTFKVTLSNMLSEPQYYSVMLAQLCTYAWMFWNHSFFILGGCYWYKKPFLKVLGVMFGIGIFLLIAIGQIAQWIGGNHLVHIVQWFEENVPWMTVNNWLTFGCCFFVFFALINWWLAYRLFTRSQVIKPKFRLL